MSEAAETIPTQSPIVEQLGGSRVDVRRDLQISRHLDGGQVHYIVRDPLTFGSHRFNGGDYKIFIRIDRRRTLSEIFSGLVKDRILEEADAESFFEFVVSMHRLGFLDLPIPDESLLFDRHEAKQKAKNIQRLMGVFFLQIPIWNPNRFLDRTAAVARILFSKWALLLWCLLQLVAGVIAVRSLDELTAPLGQILIADNVGILWGTLIGLKLVHEFGHAWACKRFGGVVPDMGVFLIAFTPCAYVDATASWGFNRKYQRLIVAFGGMYFELAVAAVALIVWSQTTHPLIASISYNVVFLASVATLIFNANPMMKSDGYFALSDILGVPNLRQRATEYAGALGKWLSLGTAAPKCEHSFGMKGLFVAFGLCLPVYRVGIVLGISMAIATKLYVLGLLIGGAYILIELTKVSTRLVQLFFLAEETKPVRIRAATLGILSLAALPALLAGTPAPNGLLVDAAVRAEREVVLRASHKGQLDILHRRLEGRIEGDATVALVTRPDEESELIDARKRLAEAELRCRAMQIEDPVHLPGEQARRDAVAKELANLESRYAARRIRAPWTGNLLIEDPDLIPGIWVDEGDPLARLVGGDPIVHAFVKQDQMARSIPKPGAAIEFRPSSESSRVYAGEIIEVTRLMSREVDDRSLTQEGGGLIVLDPTSGESQESFVRIKCRLEAAAGELPFGSTGSLRLETVPETLAVRAYRKAMRLLERLRTGAN